MTRHITVACVLVGILVITGLTGLPPASPTVAAFTAAPTADDPAEVFEGALDDDDNAEHRLWIPAGNRIVLRGWCDGDCTDVDLALRSPLGREVAADRDPDDTPYIAYTATRTGVHVIDVEMFKCSENPCRYEVSVTR